MIRIVGAADRRCLAVLLAAAMWLAGCGARSASPVAGGSDVPVALRGTEASLLIVGGGLSRSNHAVYRAFLERATERALSRAAERGEPERTVRIAVLPTASGVPAESGAATTEALRSHATEPGALRVDVLPISIEHPDAAEDRALAERIVAADGIWFTGGDQSRITAILRPDGRSTTVDSAIDRAIGAGVIIAGTSAGAAMMSDPMITGGRSEGWLRQLIGRAGGRSAPEQPAAGASGELGVEPSDDGPDESSANPFRLASGMGYYRHGVTDQHFLARGRLGRLIAATMLDDRRLGVGVSDDRAILVDASSGGFVAIGDLAAVVIDGRSASMSAEGVRGLRVSVLSDGDRWVSKGGRGQVEPSSQRRSADPRARSGSAKDNPVLQGDAWSPDGVTEALRVLALGESEHVTLRSRGFDLRWSRAEDTVRFVPAEVGASWGIDGVRLDVVPRAARSGAETAP